MHRLNWVAALCACSVAACASEDKASTTAGVVCTDAGTSQDSASLDSGTAGAPDVQTPPDAQGTADVPCTTTEVAVCEPGWTKPCSCADGAAGLQTCKDKKWDAACTCTYPPKPGEPGWIPETKDAHGCQIYEHWVEKYQECLPDNAQIQADELACWSVGQVNDLGVGKPCWPGQVECSGLKAGCCHIDDRGYGAICTMYCAKNNDFDPACGPDAWCGPMHVCMPAKKCAAGFTDSQKPKTRDVTTLGLACDLTSTYANPDGVGTKCTTTGAECGGLNWCLGGKVGGKVAELKAGVSSFCTHGCQTDADCGAGASCVFSNNKPYFCAPSTCKAQFASFTMKNPDAPDPNKPVCNSPPAP
jgi:hypothetical protein